MMSWIIWVRCGDQGNLFTHAEQEGTPGPRLRDSALEWWAQVFPPAYRTLLWGVGLHWWGLVIKIHVRWTLCRLVEVLPPDTNEKMFTNLKLIRYLSHQRLRGGNIQDALWVQQTLTTASSSPVWHYKQTGRKSWVAAASICKLSRSQVEADYVA